MPSRTRRALRLLALVAGGTAAVAAVAATGAGLWLRSELRASLPVTSGQRPLPGLSAAVKVERDALGVPTVTGKSREDVARATGFLHAQERFFQMDLQRRQAAGELAELFGAAALPSDRRYRPHRFREGARRALEALPPDQRRIADAYGEGVNSGLAALKGPPFEYLLMRTAPAPWAPEDTLLTGLAMFVGLQESTGARERRRQLMHALLPPALVAFLLPPGTEWDAPLSGEALPQAPLPGPEALDLRRARAGSAAPASGAMVFEPPMAGSNNWALSGTATGTGAAIVANDMHLELSVPNIWYRASLVWTEPGGTERRVTGATLPGAPAMAVGSTGRIAWGFTNSYGDWSDLVVVERDPADPERYLSPSGSEPFHHFTERIEVAGGEGEILDVVWTRWGPLVGKDTRQRDLALRWTAHDPQAVDLGILGLETAAGLEEALDAAAKAGIPAQNIVVADAAGRIGWTICGRIPRRVGFDGSLPASWSDGRRRWDGYLGPAEVPRVVDPPEGRLWTANARATTGPALVAIGDGGYDLGARARQIRDDLRALPPTGIEPAAMLTIQLDDRALFLERWRTLLLSVLTPDACAADPRREDARRLVEGWGGRASVDSAGFRIVRTFRLAAAEEFLPPLLVPCREADPAFALPTAQGEGPLWRLVSERPLHLLEARHPDWESALLEVVDVTVRRMLESVPPEAAKDGPPSLAERTWGERNTAHIRHPLSRAIPRLARWLDMPATPLPGAEHMPRVQQPAEGASQRMAVSPGREAQGYFHMPGGQSGHPLSPHYRDGHEAWERGEPTPFLPGPPVSTFTLLPNSGLTRGGRPGA